MEVTKLIPAKDNSCHVGQYSGEAQDVDFHKVKLVDSPTSKWLGTIDSSLPSEPSLELTCFLSKCDVSTDITSRANIILEAIFTIFGLENPCGEWVKKRKNEALTLYYRVLVAMCTAEAQTLSNLTSLLTSERFHRSMLTCSAELVLSAHNTSTMLFIPLVLERTGITGYDLCKVIESFVRYEKCLPKKLRHHLNSLEERLLESVVWEKGSSLYNSLSVAKPTLSGEIHRLCLFAESMPSLDSIALSSKGNDFSPDRGKRKRLCTEYRGVLVERNSFTTPIKHRMTPRNNLKTKLPRPALQFALGSELSPIKPNPRIGEEACAEVEIDVFFAKVLKVAAVKIKGMVERLKLSEKMRESIYCLFNLTLFKETSLFFNRHLDHIILCCFYMVAKMVQRNLKFRELIVIHRKQQQYRQDVYRRVFVDRSADRYTGKTGLEHVGLDAFYNEIFLYAIKPLLVELSPDKIEDSPLQVLIQRIGSPNMSPFSSLPDHSPKQISAKHNVYVSPLRSPKMEAFISNGSNSSYALIGENTHPFQSPSQDLRIINDRLNGNRKRKVKLNFDDKDHGILISDSTVANCLFTSV